MARAGDSNLGEQIKELFKQLDTDGNGSISRNELREVLCMLRGPRAQITKEDIDFCLREADTNENGLIEYNEFVDWIMTPGARIAAGKGGLEEFKLEDVLFPLFQVFDRNGDGSISSDEFEECFCILQNSMRMSAKTAFQASAETQLTSGEASEVFREIDGAERRDKKISFPEFVRWQRQALQKSGLLNQDLIDLLPALARQLQRVFKFTEAAERGLCQSDEDVKVLEHIIDNLASFAQDLWNEDHLGHSSVKGRVHYTNRWADPPAGLNVERLLRQYLGSNGVRLQDLDKFDLQVICLPELVNTVNSVMEVEPRRWIARVSQACKHDEAGRASYESHAFLTYKNLAWVQCPESDELYNKALESFGPGMRFFCLLKTMANFGVELSYTRVMATMKTAVDFGLIEQAQSERYGSHMEAKVLESVAGDATNKGLTRKKLKQKAQDLMSTSLVVSLRSVMSTLVALGFFEMSSKLADLLLA